jgi:hypothetical protein
LLWLNGEDDAALAIFKSLNNEQAIAMVQAGAGRFNEAADTLSLLSAPAGSSRANTLEESVRLLHLAPKTVAATENSLPAFVYLSVGVPGKVLEYYERNVEAGWMANQATSLLWHPSYAPMRKMERFRALVRASGMVDYWRAKGWPEFCHPTTADDFVCN